MGDLTLLGAGSPAEVGGGPPEAPTDGIVLRLRADLGVTDAGGGRVSAWADQSGHSEDVAQATGGNQPLLVANVINGQPAIRFDKSRPDFLQRATTPVLTQPCAVVGVFANRDAFSANFIDAQGNDQGIIYHFPGLGTYGTYALNDDTNTLPTDGSFVTFEVYFNGAGSSLYQDGNLGVNGGNGNPWSWAGLNIGNYHGGGFASSMDVAELLIYDHVLDTDERAALLGYFADRYGL